MLRLLETRTAACLLVGVLFADWCRLPVNTLCGAFHVNGLTRTCCYFGPHPCLVRTAEGSLSVVDDPPDDAVVITSLLYRPREFDAGFWAPTRHTTIKTLYLPAKLAPEARQVHALFADYLVATRDRHAPDAPLLRSGGSVTSTVLPLGYLHDLVPTACLAALFVSLRGRSRWAPLFETTASRRYRLLHSGACPGCGYSLNGLRPGAVCPECGDPLGP